ncbi:ATP-binding cassette sub-family F member 3 isoform X1 [Pseudomyrmex gracilis]|uniref:ATP-binding cassette sub-family F member 3 isoform X1 n=1 Tax=Pseudomyrmex gracilis TaxID=219809 RepID=UPI000995B62D|nr:ATP-binding cassette sub-family F member 3 isoform X1 [Pseudomyrmex gracilis]XP_020291429.1 ATP-binding cassette sub-family F member 3 isoform X1 [Pseudomyrmex gracilis]
MATCGEYIRSQFPTIDDDLYQYVKDILDSSKDDFEDGDEIYEAIGQVLHEVADKSENEVRQICVKLLEILKGSSNNDDINRRKNGVNKVLNAPVHLGSLAATLEAQVEQIKSIWVTTRDDGMKVDAKKLEKAEAKLQQKQEKRIVNEQGSASRINTANYSTESAASASQMMSKKDSRMETKGGMNKTQDIRIENFDVAYGDRVLLQGADLTLAFGRRYGLIGRNGLGKTTLLRMISSKQLRIPSHVRVLHVEQEVAGNDTSALESVLECDQERSALLSQEARLQAAIEKDGSKTGDALGEDLARVYEAMQLAEVDKAPARASAILSGLGFSVERQSWPTKAFSGGWRMRLALARALFSKPDLLLLDEPTNMLDIKAILWLEKYLQTWPTTLLVVSHDRKFLDTVPTDILYLRGQKIEAYRGNYEQFVKTKGERERNQQREYEAQQAKRAHVQEFIDKFRYNANRASSVQSKIKMLEKLPDLKPMEKESEVTLNFPDVEPLSPPILQLNEVSFSYNAGDMVFSNVNLTASLQSRICIVGENGAGKTTLLKIITGALSPTRGTVHVHRNLKFGYFSQHHVDQLDMRVCPVELLQMHFPGKPIEEYRRMLGSFGISGNLALQTINSLSGGQKSRVAFALMCAAMPNFLVLDEPTNHLDIESIEALGKALNNCQAGVILVSHDERLIRMVCTELWVCGEGSVRCIEEGFDEYRRIIERELEL